MRQTRIKICGITRAEDAVAAGEAGADAIGMVFYPPAPRNVTMERAGEIMAKLPAFVTPVALFVNAETRLILNVAEELRLCHVQLHGQEEPEQVGELRGLSVIKAIRVTAGGLAAELKKWREAIRELRLSNLKAIVLESGGTKQAGGTGLENDWECIRQQQQAGGFEGLPAVIAAGGLTPENAGKVVRELRPWAVDVSSGVERQFGQKSQERIEAFVRAVRKADSKGQ